MKIKNQIFLLSLACLALWGCSPTLPMVIDEEIDYSQEINLTWNEYAKLSYLLEWMIDLENDKSDTWNKPILPYFAGFIYSKWLRCPWFCFSCR